MHVHHDWCASRSADPEQDCLPDEAAAGAGVQMDDSRPELDQGRNEFDCAASE